ncbi:MAG TPA: hypothetical protein VFV54_01780, partial [Thermoanaerobaculia bacterium]|nr:hypothetical protein [Thermoanaerobaculia bacterium]
PAPDAVGVPAPETQTPRAAPVRRVVVFVDLTTVGGIRRKNAIKSISEFLDQLAPEDERMIVSWDDAALKIEVAPGTDRETERATLKNLGRRPSANWSRGLPVGGNMRQSFVTQRRNRLHRSVLAVRALLSQMKALDGRKALVLVTAGFPLRPGREVMVGPNFDADTRAVKLYDDFVVEARRMLDGLGDAANAAGVTIYTIHALGDAPSVATEPYRVPDPGGVAPGTNLVLPPIGVNPIYMDNGIRGQTVLAEKSGGTATARTNDLASAFHEIRQDLASYYSLGYHLSGSPDAKRDIAVRMRDPKLTARARTSVASRSPEGAAEETVVASLALPESPWGSTASANELGITAEIEKTTRTARGARRIAVDVRIPLASLSWEEDEEGLVAKIALFIGAADAEKTLTEVEKFDHEIRVARASVERGDFYTYVFDVDLRTRTADNDIAIAVVDEGSGLTGHAVVSIGAKRDPKDTAR